MIRTFVTGVTIMIVYCFFEWWLFDYCNEVQHDCTLSWLFTGWSW